MGKCSDFLRERLAEAYKEHGLIAAVVRKSGLSRRAIEKWRDGESSPSVENLELIAEALGSQAWELIKPPEAIPTPSDVPAQSLPALLEIATLLPAMDERKIKALLIQARTLAGKEPLGEVTGLGDEIKKTR